MTPEFFIQEDRDRETGRDCISIIFKDPRIPFEIAINRPGLQLWERVRTGKLDADDAMAILRDREPKCYAQLSTYKRLQRFIANGLKGETCSTEQSEQYSS